MDRSDRFAFGENWQSFLRRFTPSRLDDATQSLRDLLGRARLDGCSFLDAGSGSGLFSAAAVGLGAAVVSFDYDEDSVEATRSLRPHGAEDTWRVVQGSLLDEAHMRQLGAFDVVYCWGVAHHTGKMWQALDSLSRSVRPGGKLVISIYNHQGRESRLWTWVKRQYNATVWLRPALIAYAWLRLWALKSLIDLVRLRPFHSWRTNCDDKRGMTAWHDLIDWIGGYPFEVARPDDILDFYRARGFTLEKMKTCAGGHGCNEFVFSRVGSPT